MSLVFWALPNSFWVVSPTSPFRLKCCSRLVSVSAGDLGSARLFFWGNVPHWPLASFDLSSCEKGGSQRYYSLPVPYATQCASAVGCHVVCSIMCFAMRYFNKQKHVSQKMATGQYSRQARRLISLQKASAPSAENCCGACALADTWVNASLLPNWLQV